MNNNTMSYATGFIYTLNENEFIVGDFEKVQQYIESNQQHSDRKIKYKTIYLHKNKEEMNNFVGIRMRMQGYKTRLVKL